MAEVRSIVSVAAGLETPALSVAKEPPDGTIEQGDYELRFAPRSEELDAILRLRFNVFNLELGEGLEESFATGRDEDLFDSLCHHLLVVERSSKAIVGTYRMLTQEMLDASGFYSAAEFRLDQLPPSILGDGVEVGRACIVREHRNRKVLFLLWRGLARYVSHFDKRYLFGCCSITSQRPEEGIVLHEQLRERGLLHPELHVDPVAGFECRCAQSDLDACSAVEVPRLFETYLRYGGLVCGWPAIDRRFKTIDFLVLLDVQSLDSRTWNFFFD